MVGSLKDEIVKSSKWSFATELLAKLVVPVTNMILARLLVPEAFGVVAMVTMVTTFAEMLSIAGFQKYIVQHDFDSEEDERKQVLVAFWSNLFLALILWLIIAIFDEQIAVLVGSKGLGIVITIASVSIPINAVSSIQIALLQRSFKFKALFKLRLLTIFIPLIVTVPLAYYGFGYWALVIGTIVTNFMAVVVLLILSPYKISFYYDFNLLRGMLSFSIWSLIEAISIWLTVWSDVFIIAALLSTYYLGIYKNAMTAVNSCLAIVTAATTPILFSALSRLQNNSEQYNYTFFSFQKLVALFVVPMGVGIYCYRDIVVAILFGAKWHDADLFVGLWGLSSAMMIVLGHYCSEVYRSKGMPRISFLAQVLHLVVLIPVIYWAASSYSFEGLIWARALVRIQAILVDFLFMYFVIKISPLKMITNILPFLGISILMVGLSTAIRPLFVGIGWSLFTIIICIVFYFFVLTLIPEYRNLLVKVFSHIFTNKHKSCAGR